MYTVNHETPTASKIRLLSNQSFFCKVLSLVAFFAGLAINNIDAAAVVITLLLFIDADCNQRQLHITSYNSASIADKLLFALRPSFRSAAVHLIPMIGLTLL